MIKRGDKKREMIKTKENMRMHLLEGDIANCGCQFGIHGDKIGAF